MPCHLGQGWGFMQPADDEQTAALALLESIRSDLDPEGFTQREVEEEFGATVRTRKSQGLRSINVGRDLQVLLHFGLIEKADESGCYHVTEAGSAVEFSSETGTVSYSEDGSED